MITEELYNHENKGIRRVETTKMSDFKVVKLRRGTTLQHETFTGAQGEVTIDTDKWTAIVHDGITPGGFPLKIEAATYDKQRYVVYRAALVQQNVASLGFSAALSNAPTPLPIIESSGLITGVAAFAHGAGQSIQDHFTLPENWVPPVTIEILWQCDQLIGEVTWNVETLGVPPNTLLNSNNFNGVQSVTTVVGVQPLALTISTISDLNVTNMAPEGEFFFRLTRDPSDTLTTDAQLLGLRFIILIREQ